MSLSFVLSPAPHPETTTRRKVLVTGAAGRIGSYFAAHAHDHYDLRLTDRSFVQSPPELVGHEPQDDFARENPAFRESGVICHIMTHNQSDGGQASGIRGELVEKKCGWRWISLARSFHKSAS